MSIALIRRRTAKGLPRPLRPGDIGGRFRPAPGSGRAVRSRSTPMTAGGTFHLCLKTALRRARPRRHSHRSISAMGTPRHIQARRRRHAEDTADQSENAIEDGFVLRSTWALSQRGVQQHRDFRIRITSRPSTALRHSPTAFHPENKHEYSRSAFPLHRRSLRSAAQLLLPRRD